MSVLLPGATALAVSRRSEPPAQILSTSFTELSVFDPALWPFQGIIVTDVTSLPVRFNRTISGQTLLKSALVKRSFEQGGASTFNGFTPLDVIQDPFAVARAVVPRTQAAARSPPVSGVPGMSLSIKAGKAGMMQIQPSIFGGIGRFLGGAARTIGGLAPGPVGGILRGIGGLLAPSRPGIGTKMQFVQQAPPRFPPVLGLPLPGRPPIVVQQVPTPGVGGAIERFLPGGATGFQPAGGCPAGFHPNKGGYFTQAEGFVPKGTKCVKNRRRNPLNPRALDRAIGRITSAKRASAKLGRITIRSACPPKRR